MAEILLSLTIIGVVAAITLPSLTGNINERTWNTQRKALYARMSQAISLMPALNGYGTLAEDADGNVAADTAAETFITNGLAKVLKINNICDSEHLADCGIPEKMTNYSASQLDFPKDWNELNPQMVSMSFDAYSFSMINAKVVAFETQNGESVALFYQPRCVATSSYVVQPNVCVNMIFDMNGAKGPNTVGKDIGFLTVLNPSDSVVVSPYPITSGRMNFYDVISELTAYCRKQDNARLPNRDELVSMFVNRNLLNLDSAQLVSAPPNAYQIHMPYGASMKAAEGYPYTGWCVKRN